MFHFRARVIRSSRVVGLAIQIAVDAHSRTPRASVASAARCRNPVRRTSARGVQVVGRRGDVHLYGV
jgi:hypothetical protein